MIRPCFLVIDREYAGSISTRKLVIETAKFNVITAYSGEEAIGMLAKFPAVSGIVLDARVVDVPHDELVQRLKEIKPRVPVIVIGAFQHDSTDKADHHLNSFEPAKLLELLKTITPNEAKAIEAHDERLGKLGPF